ncbi:MAG: RNA polymerase sigma factor [Microbacteriaceae bacterium]|nr:RNA polymerase sigma factor [Microbacteriaceae bacterium]
MDEAALVARAAAGDQRAFATLMAPYRDRLWAVCLRTTRHRGDAEDALQEALVAVWHGLERFRGDSAFSSWCHRIAVNAALQVIRRRKEAEELPEEWSDEHPQVADFSDGLADRDRVQAALAQVPEAFRVALVLREFGDLSYEEIAAHQGILVDTVKSRISRARAALRKALAEA